MITFKKMYPYFVPVMIALVFLVRVAGLDKAAIWYDEAFSLGVSKLPVSSLISLMSRLDYTPPLWEMILKLFSLGRSVAILRVIPCVFSILALYFEIKIIDRIYKNDPGILRVAVLFLFTFLPGVIWYSQDLRMYSLLSFLYVLAIWFAFNSQYWELGVCFALMLYTHTTGAAYMLGAAALSFYINPKAWRKLAIATIGAGLLYLPWLPHLGNGISGHWLMPLTGDWFASQFLFAFWAGSLSPFATVLSFLLIVVTLIILTIWIRNSIPFFITFSIPLLALLAVSFVLHNVIIYRTLSPLLIPFALWFIDVIPSLNKFTRYGLVALWTLMIATAFIGYNPAVRGGYLDQAANYIRANYQAGDLIYYGAGSVAMPFDYYLHDLPSRTSDLQPIGLGSNEILIALGYKIGPLTGNQRAWVIYPLDPLITQDQANILKGYSSGGRLITTVYYYQAAPIQIWLVNSGGN